MRKKLLKVVNSNYWLYGLRERDFDFTLRLTGDILAALQCKYDQVEKEARENDPETADDYLDDIAHYNFLDTKYVLHFTLWRLQAVFEGILFFTFIKPFYSQKLIGLSSKLKKLRKIGYTITDKEYEVIINWGNLRNILSHAPPEEFNPIEIEMKDILEYKKLVTKICNRFNKEKETLKVV